MAERVLRCGDSKGDGEVVAPAVWGGRGDSDEGDAHTHLKPKTMTLEESLGHSQTVRYRSL